MHYFIFTFEVYLNFNYVAGGKIGKPSLLNKPQNLFMLKVLNKHYSKIFRNAENLKIKIKQTKKVFYYEYEIESIDFIEI